MYLCISISIPFHHISIHILDILARARAFVFTPCICSCICVTGFTRFARILVTGWWQSEYWGLGRDVGVEGGWVEILIWRTIDLDGLLIIRHTWGHCVDGWVKMGTRWASPFSGLPLLGVNILRQTRGAHSEHFPAKMLFKICCLGIQN